MKSPILQPTRMQEVCGTDLTLQPQSYWRKLQRQKTEQPLSDYLLSLVSVLWHVTNRPKTFFLPTHIAKLWCKRDRNTTLSLDTLFPHNKNIFSTEKKKKEQFSYRKFQALLSINKDNRSPDIAGRWLFGADQDKHPSLGLKISQSSTREHFYGTPLWLCLRNTRSTQLHLNLFSRAQTAL